MKRIFVLVLALCLILCACGKGSEDPSTETTTTVASTTEETVIETTEQIVLYRHPLNGAPLDEPFTGRALAVVIPNDSKALPHYGVSQADVLYEVEAEGGITRCLALFTNLDFEGKIGPVRSARTYFNNVAISYDAPIAHCGGSPGGRTGQYDSSGDTIANWPHIDEFYNGAYFFRDSDRASAGYAYEYTLFTRGELLTKCMEKRGYNTVTEGGTDYGLQFADVSSAASGEMANKVNVGFRGSKKTVMTYNPATQLYSAYQHGGDYIDGNTKEVMTFRNLLILQAEQWYDTSGYRTYYDLIGSGNGLYACDGKIIPIKWERETLRENFSYTLEDGTPLTLGVGNSYIAIASMKSTTTYE